MSIFHFVLYLVPEEVARARTTDALSDEEVEAGEDPQTGWWANRQPSSETLHALRGLLPVDSSWGVEEFTDGADVGCDLRIWKSQAEGPVWAVTFRFSSLTEDWQLLTSFLEIARRAGCWLLERESATVLPPDDEVVRSAYARSRARRARRDPVGSLVEAADALKRENQ